MNDEEKPLDPEALLKELLEKRRREQALIQKKEEEAVDDLLREHSGEQDKSQAESIDIQGSSRPVKIEFDMKPKEVKEYLDKYVIKQDKAKKYLSIAICYHYGRIKRVMDDKNNSDAFIKKNVLMIGNTGVGKTYLVQKLSKLVGVPFVKEDATKFTAAGYVGRDVEDIVKDLYLAAGQNKELAQYGIIYIDEIDKIRKEFTISKDVGGAEVQHGLLKLLEETEIDLSESINPLIGMRAVNNIRGEKGRDGKDRGMTINTKHILFIMGGAFPGLEDIVKKRTGLEQDPPESALTEEELKKMNYDVYRLEKTDWYDYLTAQDLVEYGFEPEFIGRVPIRVGLDELEAEDLYQILKKSKDSVIKQYKNDFAAFGIKVKFTDGALRAFAERAMRERTGARALVSVIEDSLLDYLYELPSTSIKEFTITEDVVNNPKKELVNLIINETIRNYAEKIYEEAGIRITFDRRAVDYLKRIAVNDEKSLSGLCDEMLEKYIPALKLYEKDNFRITEAIIKNPAGYLKKMLKRYSNHKKKKTSAIMSK